MSTGGDGLLILAQREYKLLTYRSLQPRNDFTDRGVSQLPNYFYRDHSLMLWEAIHKYITDTMVISAADISYSNNNNKKKQRLGSAGGH